MILLPSRNFSHGAFAYGIGLPTAPAPVRMRHFYTIGDTGMDLWSIRDEKTSREWDVTSDVIDRGLCLVPYVVGDSLRRSLRNSVTAKVLPGALFESLIAQWIAKSPSINEVYETFLRQFRVGSLSTDDMPYIDYCWILVGDLFS